MSSFSNLNKAKLYENRQPAERVVAMASSAGGLKALIEILAALPAHFPAAVLVVQHLDPHYRSMMADILDRRCQMPVRQAQDNEELLESTVYIAPPDRHMLVNGEHMVTLTDSEQVHFVRPSANLLFVSVAENFGNRAIAVVLTGTGKDGAMGVEAIKQAGGRVIAQDEATSEFFGMPDAAIHTGMVDLVLPIGQIAKALVEFASGENDLSYE